MADLVLAFAGLSGMGAFKPSPAMRTAAKVFYKHAGAAKRPDESWKQARIRGAHQLARAEEIMRARGWYVDWDYDEEPDTSGIEDAKEILCATLRSRNGKHLQSLCGIADPSREYARVVEAELALEEIAQHTRRG